MAGWGGRREGAGRKPLDPQVVKLLARLKQFCIEDVDDLLRKAKTDNKLRMWIWERVLGKAPQNVQLDGAIEHSLPQTFVDWLKHEKKIE